MIRKPHACKLNSSPPPRNTARNPRTQSRKPERDNMDLGLKDKVALVAASSKGLGYGVARALAREGARVSICSRNEAEIKAAADRLKKETGAQVLATAFDVKD